jgi:hypothetical protein
MAINDTTTHKSTVRDAFNSGILGKESDASQKAPLGDILSILLDVANTAVAVSAVTVGTSVTATLAPTATAAVVVTATAVQASAVAATAATTYSSPDTTLLHTLANANQATVNQCVTDIKTLITQINKVTVDLAAAKVDTTALTAQVNAAIVDITSLRACMAATATAGTMGGATQAGTSITSYITGTLTALPSSIVSVHGYGTTPGVLRLIRDPQHVLVSGEVFWDGNLGLKFCAADLLTTFDAIYAKADLSQKVSCLMAPIADIV